MVPPVARQVTGILPVSPAAVNPTAINVDVWFVLSAISSKSKLSLRVRPEFTSIATSASA